MENIEKKILAAIKNDAFLGVNCKTTPAEIADAVGCSEFEAQAGLMGLFVRGFINIDRSANDPAIWIDVN